MSEARWLVGDVFERLAEIPDGSVDLIVTSPPFLALRSYLPADHPDKAKEIGSEPTPAAFLSTLLALTREWRRVLAPHGSLCVELGDTYAGSGGAGGDYAPADPTNGTWAMRAGQPKFDGSAAKRRSSAGAWPLDKSLCLIPTLYPASLAYGRNLLTGQPCEPWRIRNQIVWHRPNPPVGALGDKVRPSTSYITVACTSRTRWFDLDAERTPSIDTSPRNSNGPKALVDRGDHLRVYETRTTNEAGAPPLDCWLDEAPDDVWTLSTQPYKGSHYATFPITLPRKLINLMCPRQVCTTCREPRRRIVETEYVEDPTGGGSGHTDNGTGLNGTRRLPTRLAVSNTTLGWTNCGCGEPPTDNESWINGHPKYRRGIVLDPFAGSGTTLVAASELGRDSIGIDIDSKNLQLARERCGMFLTEPDEVTA